MYRMATSRKKGKNVGNEDTPASSSLKKEGVNRMRHLFGFDWSDLSSIESIIRLMNRPTDPASLGITRFFFGLLMVVDIPQERGLSHLDYKFGDDSECRFPLFNLMGPLPLEWMYMVYLVMFLGAFGIMVGFLFRLSCLMFITTYWYSFLLDKTVWNNHSYLYGLTGFMLLFSDANRYWSIDGLLWPKKRNAHVPLFNYCLLRSQIFLVYFIAGLKKLDRDWMFGHSMTNLSKHWVFTPFTLVLSQEMVDLWIVHVGGLTLDLFIGYFLFFDVTRPFAMFFGLMFHSMNSQLFSIGMFPYTMIATMPLFCYADWPKKLFRKAPSWLAPVLPLTADPQPNEHCLYPKAFVKREDKERTDEVKPYSSVIVRDKPGRWHKNVTLFIVSYLAVQCFLPYSHFVTKGYNNWTNGLYGYSWDMMVHSWSTQHMRLTYINKDTGEVGFLKPEAWTHGSRRWSSHADMLKQYAYCIQERMQQYNLTNIELHFDIWRSLNHRFQQRMFDPRVDMLTAAWSPFKATPWLMPLLTDLSDWRGKLESIQKEIYDGSNDTDVVFIADFPGLTLENYVQEDLGNTTLTVLKGEVIVELVEQNKSINVAEGEKIQLPAGEYHNVHTITSSPACYMYIFFNTTERELHKNLTEYEQRLQEKEAAGIDDAADDVNNSEDPYLVEIYRQTQADKQAQELARNATILEKFSQFIVRKYEVFTRGATMTRIAFQSIIRGEPFQDVYNATNPGGEETHIDVE